MFAKATKLWEEEGKKNTQEETTTIQFFFFRSNSNSPHNGHRYITIWQEQVKRREPRYSKPSAVNATLLNREEHTSRDPM
jgi:hypothetical protein